MIRRRLGQALMVIALAPCGRLGSAHPGSGAGRSDRGRSPATTLLDPRPRPPIKAHLLVHRTIQPVCTEHGHTLPVPGDPPEGGWPIISWALGYSLCPPEVPLLSNRHQRPRTCCTQ